MTTHPNFHPNTDPDSEFKAYILQYKDESILYFTHAISHSSARWKIIKRLHRRRGFTSMRAHRLYAMDDVPFTYERLRELGYVPQKPAVEEEKPPICMCELCYVPTKTP